MYFNGLAQNVNISSPKNVTMSILLHISTSITNIGRKALIKIFKKYSIDIIKLVYKHFPDIILNKNTEPSDCAWFNFGVDNFNVTLNGSVYPKTIPLFDDKKINFSCLQESHSIKTILLWTTFFGEKDFGLGLGLDSFVKFGCPVTKCSLTNDKQKLTEADLVVVHMREEEIIFPRYKRPWDQRWVFTLYESPVYSFNFDDFDHFFNLTSTYRIDSDFPHFYDLTSSMRWKKNEEFDERRDFYAEKNKFAVAIISNCYGKSQRLEYIKELKNYIHFDIYGKCGQPCPDECKKYAAKEYKFYFAFENSICKDYITEKFFEMLQFDIVPVVLGGGDYEHYVPKSGFINAMDFKNPRHLADYLLFVNNNSRLYNSFFAWKKNVVFNQKFPKFAFICNMCIKLHMERFTGIKEKSYTSVEKYWNQNTCRSI
ncbi:alpha-(1-3)-fucosyltransferase C-like [Brachionus plicatilis]|uniref:Fucosyltransferase n=1 Tax=Brachionus plicatilis TaxID=10195 RepID=A0A3M7Q6S4_BRAPC|nr:alpha-(1-3)-fucosyltransferase C-like [Brachionus plicatilis]